MDLTYLLLEWLPIMVAFGFHRAVIPLTFSTKHSEKTAVLFSKNPTKTKVDPEEGT